jgi:methyltransferase family protein
MAARSEPRAATDGDPADPYDRRRSGYSLSNDRELVFACLNAARVGSVVEVGAQHGSFTRELLDWAAPSVRVAAVDPAPEPELVALAAAEPRLELIDATSSEALRELPRFDAYVIDGDHNYFTVLEELRAVEAAAEGEMPLVLMHDVGWPFARRDYYYEPSRIPENHRQPLAHYVRLVPWGEGIDEHIGITCAAVAASEGGPQNGVLTAIEDFIADRRDLRFARLAPFFGLGVLWPADAEWAGDVAAAVARLDGDPVIERLEGNRIVQTLERDRLERRLADLERSAGAERQRLAGLEAEVHRLLGSRALTVAERLSRLKPGTPAISRERLRRLLTPD